MDRSLVQVLGAVAYGEWKAHEKAKARAQAASDEPERRAWRTIAAEELRHHKGFVRRLEAVGADPERAMRPYRASLDRYHDHGATTAVELAVLDYLGEGIADDLLKWLRQVADPDTATFVENVLADEAGHEARAAAELRVLLAARPQARREAGRAARRMVTHMLASGAPAPARFAAFLKVGAPVELVTAIVRGQLRRLAAIGLMPFGIPLPTAA